MYTVVEKGMGHKGEQWLMCLGGLKHLVAINNSYLIQNSQAIKKSAALRKAMVKKDVNPRWRPRNGCDGRLMVKILITTIQVNFVPRPSGTKFT